MFNLIDTLPGKYLFHKSELGEFTLSSDSVIQTFTCWKRATSLISHIPDEENEAFRSIGYTIGGMLIFPGNKVNGRQTINGARGCNQRIADRLDLTLECIRRHYNGEISPLSEPLSRYSDFFRLFEEFSGYVDFFLLNDLVTGDYLIDFFIPFDDFRSAIPTDKASYIRFRQRSIEFVNARNQRIALQHP